MAERAPRDFFAGVRTQVRTRLPAELKRFELGRGHSRPRFRRLARIAARRAGHAAPAGRQGEWKAAQKRQTSNHQDHRRDVTQNVRAKQAELARRSRDEPLPPHDYFSGIRAAERLAYPVAAAGRGDGNGDSVPAFAGACRQAPLASAGFVAKTSTFPSGSRIPISRVPQV